MQQVMTAAPERRAVRVQGIVQGVGFRPFVYALAHRCGLSGCVRNDAEGVRIEVEGAPGDLECFLRALVGEAPPLARVEAVTWEPLPLAGDSGFHIDASRSAPARRTLVSPDVATCGACLRELFDTRDRRYRYPFINCTDCGPRFTIVRGVPYDRPLTTMAGFAMCERCRVEYEDPANRRFHAQPNACPDCGPQVRLVDPAGRELQAGADPLRQAAALLRAGAVLAVKGLGGYHLACDPCNPRAVAALRARKARQDKPFALMARDIDDAGELCEVRPEEAELLQRPARPIVLLERRPGCRVDPAVAPRQRTLGVMLAYTPLHHLLLGEAGLPLVMTSGNRSDEPIAYRDEDAFEQLAGIADAFLVHNRPIHVRCDDSVLALGARGAAFPIRRSRGYAPAPLRLAEPVSRPLLACGAELKAAFCLAREQHAFVSHHIGDLQNYETLRSYVEAVESYSRLFDIQPQAIACDLHPEYFATRHAHEAAAVAGLPLVEVQHHEAHVASCLADNERPTGERVIGVAFDGTGLGTDGAVWGGEVFTGSVREGFLRRAHLEYVPLPGCDAAVRRPSRMVVSYLAALYGLEDMLRLPLAPLRDLGEREVRCLARMAEQGVNSPPTSSAGRLFDAVAVLLGLPGAHRPTYEGQAAVELELAADPEARGEAYPVPLRAGEGSWIFELRELIRAIVEDLRRGESPGRIAARFHVSLAAALDDCCRRLRDWEGLGAVALSGGCFQNRLLLALLTERLDASGFQVYTHGRVPANDGGLALGQAVLADQRLRRGG